MAVNLGSIYAEIRLKMDQLAGDIARAKAQLRTAAGVIESMGQEAADKLKNRMQNVSDTFAQVGAAMTGVGLGIAGALGAAVATTADFDREMSRVRALSGATEADFQRLREAAIRLGADSVYSATEAAQGMSILAAAGFNTNQILDAMPGLLAAAAASGEDFASVADIMVSAMSGFGLQARDMSHIADVLAAAANASSISIRDLGYTFKYVAPVAKSAGQSLEMMAAAAAILGNAGIKADQAGTTLRMALIRLADPPKEAAKWLQRLGVQVTDSSGRMRPLSDIIGQLNRAFRGLSQEQQIAAASAIFGAEAMSGMLTLIQAGPEQLNQLANSFRNANGAAQQMAEEMTNNLAGAWEEFKGALESMAINIGEQLTPALRTLAEAATALVDAFNALPEPVQRFVALTAALAAGLLLIGGPLLMLVGFLPSIAAGAAMASSAFTGLAAALSPITVIIAAVAAAAGLLYLAWQNNFGGIRDTTIALWNQIQAKFQEAWNVIAPLVGQLIDYIKQRWAEIQPVIQPVMNWLSTIFRYVFGFIADTVMFYIGAVVDIISGAVKVITGIIKFFVALFTGDWRGAWEAIKQVAKGALQFLWGLVQVWIVGRIAGLIGNTLNRILGFVLGFVGKSIAAFARWVAQKAAMVAKWASNLVSRAASAMNGMLKAIIRGLGNILARFGRFVWDCVRSVGNLAGRMADIGKDIV
ncbi:MAG TPA: phage tail tape measure protein, partial [Methylophilaceae bacterium]